MAIRGIGLEPAFHPFSRDPAKAIRFEFLVAAVCHATNWDRLRDHFIDVMKLEGSSPRSFSAMTLEDFKDKFGLAFGDTSDLPERYELFASVSNALNGAYENLNAQQLWSKPQHLAGPYGFYGLLDVISAFNADPQRKKSRILAQQLHRYRLVRFSDLANMLPATEYHILRLYLRTERVVHVEGVESSIASDRAWDVRSVIALRRAVEQAMHFTADGADMSLPELNDIEWQIGRSFCERETPRCAGPHRIDKPVGKDLLSIAGGACPFSKTCRGPLATEIANLVEPRLAEHHAFY